MATPRVFSIDTGSYAGTIIGVVVGDATLDGKIGDIKELIGNPSTDIEDTRVSTPTTQTLTANFAIAAGDGTDVQALDLESDAADVTVHAGGLTLEGKVTHWEVKADKSDWWIGTVTVVKEGA
jgi:hypothetical protein